MSRSETTENMAIGRLRQRLSLASNWPARQRLGSALMRIKDESSAVETFLDKRNYNSAAELLVAMYDDLHAIIDDVDELTGGILK